MGLQSFYLKVFPTWGYELSDWGEDICYVLVFWFNP